MSIDLNYYFRKQVLPPMQRVLSSLADLNQWSSSIQYRHSYEYSQPHQLQINKKCLHCSGETYFILCEKCFQFAEEEIDRVNVMCQQALNNCKDCTGCIGIAQSNKCVQWNCRYLWSRRTAEKARNNIKPELEKLREATSQLNF